MTSTSSREALSIHTLIANNAIVIFDADSIKSTGFTKFIRAQFAFIQRHSGQFVVPSFVKSNLANPEDGFALMALSRGLLQEVKDVHNFTEVFARLKENGAKNFCVLINNPTKKHGIIQAAKASRIFVNLYAINDDGIIVELPRTVKDQEPQAFKTQQPRPAKTQASAEGFVLKDRPEKIAIAPIRVSESLSVGHSVYDTQKNAYRLCKQEAVHNGAVTYSTDNPDIWVKIFEGKSLNTFTEAKIRRMLSQDISFQGICWPKSIVTDANGTFRGYTLQAFRGHSLHLCVFKRAGLETYFPSWTRLDLCILADTILKKIKYLHNKNILFGCFNPAAIFVAGNNEVYFTDTDNYQIEGFPCLTYNLSFTPPELLDKPVYFATKANEYFAVAELVFMLMMPGKTPYAVDSDEAPAELIRKMHFPYSSSQFTGHHALPGMWRFMWSHLESLKGNFYNIFQKGAKYNAPADRQDAGYWEYAVRHYHNYLLNPEDAESLKIYPSAFKRGKNDVFYRCQYCGKEHPRFYFSDKYFDNFRICNACLEKRSEVSFTCKACNKTYYYTNDTALYHRLKKMQDSEWKDQKYCFDCKKKTLPCPSCGKETPVYYIKNGKCSDCRNAVYTTKNCVDCGMPFEITVYDHESFMRKGYSDPIRCKDCRERKRNNPSSSNYSGRTSSTSTGYYSGRSSTTSSGSYSGRTSTPAPEKKKKLFGWFG